MNIKNLLTLFNGFTLNHYQIKNNNQKTIALWSSDSESSDDDRNRDRKPLDVQMQEEESESDEG